MSDVGDALQKRASGTNLFMAAINLSTYTPKFNDQFFFDTNVWLLLFGSVANYQKNDQKIYSTFLGELLSRNSSIFISSLILSEYANVQLRRDFNQWKPKSGFVDPQFKKDFVGTQIYKDSVVVITQELNNIIKLPIVVRTPDSFNALSLDHILADFEVLDFNDSYIAELSSFNNCKVVTNDRDFFKIANKIDVLSAQA